MQTTNVFALPDTCLLHIMSLLVEGDKRRTTNDKQHDMCIGAASAFGHTCRRGHDLWNCVAASMVVQVTRRALDYKGQYTATRQVGTCLSARARARTRCNGTCFCVCACARDRYIV